MTWLKLWAALILGTAQLTSIGTVSGTVQYSGIGPGAGLRVMAIAVPGAGRGGARQTSVIVSQAKTDSARRYQLEDLPNGQYFIAVGLPEAPTFYPGTSIRGEARIIKITSDAPVVSRIDFALTPNASVPPSGVDTRPCCNLSGLLLMESGALPSVPLRVVAADRQWNVDVKDGFFRVFIQRGTVTQFAVEGLPPGYTVTSIVYGGVNAGLGPMLIDGREPQSFLLRISTQPGVTVPSVSVHGKFVNVAREMDLRKLSLVLTSSLTSDRTFLSPIGSDDSFAIPSIPVGLYQYGFRDSSGNVWGRTTIEIRGGASELTMDLHNNPFPELGTPQILQQLFSGKPVEITGVVTQPLTRISGGIAYFRMDIKDELSGTVVPWAIYVGNDKLVPNIMAGETYTLMGTRAADGTNRLNAQPF